MKNNRRFVYVCAWIFAISIILASLFFSVLYGQSYGYVKSLMWLTAFSMSICISIFVFEPLEHICIAVLSSVFLPNRFYHFDVEAKPLLLLSEQQKLFKYYEQKCWEYKQMCSKSENANEEELKRKEHTLIYYRNLVMDLLMFSFYVITLMLIVLGSREPMSFYSGQHSRNYFVHGKYVSKPAVEVSNEVDFFSYMSNVLLPTIHFEGKIE